MCVRPTVHRVSATSSEYPTRHKQRPLSEPASGASASGPPARRRVAGFALLIVAVLAAVVAKPTYDRWYAYRTEQYRSACKAATEAEAWERLERIAARWVEWDPQADDGWVYLAEASTQLGKPEQAADSLGRVRDSYHGALQALAICGEIQFADLNRPYDAVATWQRMLEIEPRADMARQRLIYFYAMTLQREKMLEHIRIAMELRCEPPEAYAYFLLAYDLDFSDGLSVVQRWREHYPKDEALEVAYARYKAKYSPSRSQALFGEATIATGDLSLINECLEEYPDNLEVLGFHLDQAIYDGDEKRVRALLSRCPTAAERDPRFWRYRGWYFDSQGLYAEAEQALRNALELHPVDWRSRWLLASVLRRLRHPEAARVAEIALAGKELQRTLFELPNARSLDESLGIRIYDYLKQTGPSLPQEALARRLF